MKEDHPKRCFPLLLSLVNLDTTPGLGKRALEDSLTKMICSFSEQKPRAIVNGWNGREHLRFESASRCYIMNENSIGLISSNHRISFKGNCEFEQGL